MAFLAAYVVPHPPLVVPEVGHGQEAGIPATTAAFRLIASEIAALKPDTIVIVSPHNRIHRNFFHISGGEGWESSFGDFRAPSPVISAKYDKALALEITRAARAAGLEAGHYDEERPGDSASDHGSLVPLYFVARAQQGGQAAEARHARAGGPERLTLSAQLVRMSVSSYNHVNHDRYGRVLRDILDRSPKRIVFIASGDLSHRLKEDGPYGLDYAAPAFEDDIVAALGRGDLAHIVKYDEELCQQVGECGVRSFCILAGLLNGNPFSTELLSHEDTFGVGYAVARYMPTETTTSDQGASTPDVQSADTAGNAGQNPPSGQSEVLKAAAASRAADLPTNSVHVLQAEAALSPSEPGPEAADAAEPADRDPFVALARRSLETYIQSGHLLHLSNTELAALPPALRDEQAGVFVSLHLPPSTCRPTDEGPLRGCIGTLAPTTGSVAEEIIHNAVSAGTRDPRFPKVREGELPLLVYSVDVLGPAEDIHDLGELDVKRYGVIVESGWRRGLLLPDLEGVDSVEVQVAIARQKAGIAPGEPVRLQRFEVIRHKEVERL